MAQDIEAEHYREPEQQTTYTDKLVKSIKNMIGMRSAPKYNMRESQLTASDYDPVNQFTWDKHERLFTSALNFSYIAYPISKLLPPSVKEIGYRYTISSYTSHQTELGYNRSNFLHLGGTQYFIFQTMLRNAFQPQSGSEPALVKGYYKQFWELYEDSGVDPFTPIFSTLLFPICFYLLVPMFAYQMSFEKGEGLLSLQ